jgi:hypothetical protein
MVEGRTGKPNGIEIGGEKFLEGDIVLILQARDDEDGFGDELGAKIHTIESNGHALINYGTHLQFLNDGDQVRHAPEEMKEIISMMLESSSEQVRMDVESRTKNIRSLLVRYHETLLEYAIRRFRERFGKAT